MGDEELHSRNIRGFLGEYYYERNSYIFKTVQLQLETELRKITAEWHLQNDYQVSI